MALRRARSVVAGLVASAAVLAAPLPAHAGAASGEQASGSAFVALGDSYASGLGTRSYLADGTSCRRSTYAHPALVAAARGLQLNFRACSGATTADVAALQLGALGSATTHVSLTVGGNDAGFADVLTECAQPAWMSSCTAAIDRAQKVIDGTLPGRLSSLYAAVTSRAPAARVVVAGYPRIFNGKDCNALTWFSPTEMSRLNATADLLNTRIAAAASAAGVVFVDPTAAFTRHAVCDTAAWVNGLSDPVAESYHPNRAGQSSGYTPLVGTALTSSPVRVTAATRQAAAAAADELAAQQREYAAQDRAIEPERFVLPDLTSARARAAAARAGVDLTSRASIDALDRRYELRQVAAAR